MAAKKKTKKGFTLIELLTVMSVIVILMALLVPAMSKVKKYAKELKQRAQFHSIAVAMDLFYNELGEYPNSGADDTATSPIEYCGAMKLAEAMVGRDQLGFHEDSLFRADGTDGLGTAQVNNLYPTKADLANAFWTPAEIEYNKQQRKGPFLPIENANANQVSGLYKATDYAAAFSTTDANDHLVICDVFNRVENSLTNKKVGMPVLYYKADISQIKHDPNTTAASSTTVLDGNIYDFRDNDDLVGLGAANGMTLSTTDHAIHDDPTIFYEMTREEKVASRDWPVKADSYILWSAGYDGEYGTPDDITNFDKK